MENYNHFFNVSFRTYIIELACERIVMAATITQIFRMCNGRNSILYILNYAVRLSAHSAYVLLPIQQKHKYITLGSIYSINGKKNRYMYMIDNDFSDSSLLLYYKCKKSIYIFKIKLFEHNIYGIFAF